MGTTSPRFLDPGRPVPVSLEHGDAVEALGKALDQLLVKGRPGRAESIEAPEPFLAAFNKSRLTKVDEMAGRLGLWYLENGNDVADAELPFKEKVENPKASPVCESPEHGVDPVRGVRRNYIHASDYTLLPLRWQGRRSEACVDTARVGERGGVLLCKCLRR
jgi:hypothetical protein